MNSSSLSLESLVNSFMADNQEIEKSASEALGHTKAAGLEDLLNTDLSTREARAHGEALMTEFLTKCASDSTLTNSTDMNKAAQQKVNSLVAFAMQKLAGENTTDGITEGVAPNPVQRANAEMVAGQAASELPNAEGTITQLQDELVQRALAQGAVSTSVNAGQDAAGEMQDPQVVKAAALQTLMGKGFDFDTAVDMIKRASEGENTENGIGDGVAPNPVQRANAEMVAGQAASELPNSEGTITQLQDELVNRAISQGAVATSVNAGQDAAGERKDPQVVDADEHEKAAAVMALVQEGYGIDDAVALVKQAEEELVNESLEMQKAAALQTLIGEYGYSVDEAVAMVKQAEEEIFAENEEFEKVAAVNELVAEGYDLESAVAMVKQASEGDGYGVEAEAEFSEMEKAAAVGELVAEGYDLDTALALVKEATDRRANAGAIMGGAAGGLAGTALVRASRVPRALALPNKTGLIPATRMGRVHAAGAGIGNAVRGGVTRGLNAIQPITSKYGRGIAGGAAALGAVGGALAARKKHQ